MKWVIQKHLTGLGRYYTARPIWVFPYGPSQLDIFKTLPGRGPLDIQTRWQKCLLAVAQKRPSLMSSLWCPSSSHFSHEHRQGKTTPGFILVLTPGYHPTLIEKVSQVCFSFWLNSKGHRKDFDQKIDLKSPPPQHTPFLWFQWFLLKMVI